MNVGVWWVITKSPLHSGHTRMSLIVLFLSWESFFFLACAFIKILGEELVQESVFWNMFSQKRRKFVLKTLFKMLTLKKEQPYFFLITYPVLARRLWIYLGW